MMTCAAKELYDWDEKEKEENEQQNKGVRKRIRFHSLLQESARTTKNERSNLAPALRASCPNSNELRRDTRVLTVLAVDSITLS
jgi:hypothetical protein